MMNEFDDIFDELDDTDFVEITAKAIASQQAPLIVSSSVLRGGKAKKLHLKFSSDLEAEFSALAPDQHRIKVDYNPIAMVLRLAWDNKAPFEMSQSHLGKIESRKSFFLKIPMPDSTYPQEGHFEAKYTFRGKSMFVMVPEIFGRKPKAPDAVPPKPSAARVIVHERTGTTPSFGDPAPGRSALDQRGR